MQCKINNLLIVSQRLRVLSRFFSKSVLQCQVMCYSLPLSLPLPLPPRILVPSPLSRSPPPLSTPLSHLLTLPPPQLVCICTRTRSRHLDSLKTCSLGLTQDFHSDLLTPFPPSLLVYLHLHSHLYSLTWTLTLTLTLTWLVLSSLSLSPSLSPLALVLPHHSPGRIASPHPLSLACALPLPLSSLPLSSLSSLLHLHLHSPHRPPGHITSHHPTLPCLRLTLPCHALPHLAPPCHPCPCPPSLSMVNSR